MLAIAIIVGVVYFALNHTERLNPNKEQRKTTKSGMNSYKENERMDYQLR